MKRWFLFLPGVLLLACAAFLSFWLSGRMRLADAHVAFEPLASISISQLKALGSADLTVAVPDDAVWERIRRTWGDPEYAVASFSVQHEYRQCFDDIAAFASLGKEPLKLEPAGWIYGHSDADDPFSCKSSGVKFRASAGQKVQVHLTITDNHQSSSDAEVVVQPTWLDTKDKLVGLDLNEDLRAVAKWGAVTGALLGLVAIIPFVRVRRLRMQRSAARVDASS
jgi:hypothetical protein